MKGYKNRTCIKVVNKVTSIAIIITIVLGLFPYRIVWSENSCVNSNIDLIGEEHVTQLIENSDGEYTILNGYYQNEQWGVLNSDNDFNEASINEKSSNVVTLKLNIEDNYIYKYDINATLKKIYNNKYNYLSINNLIYNQRKVGSSIYLDIYGLEWDSVESYYFGIETKRYLLDIEVNKDDLGKTIEVTPDNSYVDFLVDIPFKGDNFCESLNNLYALDNNGKKRFVGSATNRKVKVQNYYMNYMASDNNAYYNLIKDNISVTNNTTIVLSTNEVSLIKYNIDINEYKNTLGFNIFQQKENDYLGVKYGQYISYDNTRIYITKGENLELSAGITVYEDAKTDWYYDYENIYNIKDDSIDINIGSELSIVNNSLNNKFEVESNISELVSSIKIVDQYSNEISYARKRLPSGDTETLKKELTIKDLNSEKEVIFDCSEYLTGYFPTEEGRYEYIYKVKESIVPIKELNGEIELISNDYAALPTVISAQVSNKYPKIGEDVLIEIEFNNNSNIKNVIYSYLELGYDKELQLNYNESTGKYEGKILIDEKHKYSIIEGNGIKIELQNGYSECISSDKLNELDIKVYGANGELDTTSPSIDKVIIDKNKVKVGSKVNISADISDDLSGVSIVGVVYSYKENEEVKFLKYNSSINKYEGQLDIIEDMIYCNISIEEFIAIDNVGNLSCIYKEELDNSIITVQDELGNIDTKAPELDSWSISNDASDGQRIRIKLNVTENQSGIAPSNITYVEKATGIEYKFLIEYDENEKLMICEIWKDFIVNNSKLEVVEIELKDYAENVKKYLACDMDLSELNFIVGEVPNKNEVKIDINTMFHLKNKISGKVSTTGTNLNNVKLKGAVYSKKGFTNELGEIKLNSSGEFNITDIGDFYSGMIVSLDAYNSITGEYIGNNKLTIIKDIDFNNNYILDIGDLAEMSLRYNKKIMDFENEDEFFRYNIVYDEIIDIYDLSCMSKYY